MECYYVDEIEEVLEEGSEFWEERAASDPNDPIAHTVLLVLNQIKDKIKDLDIKDFNYGE